MTCDSSCSSHYQKEKFASAVRELVHKVQCSAKNRAVPRGALYCITPNYVHRIYTEFTPNYVHRITYTELMHESVPELCMICNSVAPH